ncbi:hypothetical protein [Pseudomonas gorinensis]
MTDRPRFHVIDGTAPPDTPAEQVRRRVRAMPSLSDGSVPSLRRASR